MKKEFELSAKINTSDFDRSIQEMVKKLKDVSQPIGALQQNTANRLQSQGFGGMTPQSMEAYQRATQASKREMDALITSQAQGQERLGKIIAKRSELLSKLQIQQKDLVKGSEDELKIKEKIARVETNNYQLKEGYRQRDAALNQAMDARERIQSHPSWARARQFTGQGMYGAAGKEAYGAVGGYGGIAAGMAGIGAVVAGAGKAAEQFTGYGQRLQEARGSAIAGTAGQNLRDVYGGRSPFESAWSQERDSAAGLAAQKANRNRATDRAMGIGSALGVGAGVVGMAGSVVAAPFTGGASLSGFMPSMAVAGAGVAGLSNDRYRKGIFGGKEYEQLLAKSQAEDFRSNYEALKNQDQGKKLALENFEQFKDRNVGSQRQLGLSNQGFYQGGGFLSDIHQKGFMDEQGINMANQIVGAGGSARMGRQAGFGLQMERAGLTNASGILGTMSGSIQNPEANKRATIAIMSEAFKIGLDNTDFAEENRKFAQAAANIIGKTGVASEADQDRLSSVLGQFLGQKTNAGVQEAQNAYEKYQERGSQTGGRRGTLRFQAAMQDKDLSKMSTSDLTELISMRPEEMNASNPAMAEFARMADISVDDLIKKMTGKGGVNDAGRLIFPGQRQGISKASDTINKYMKAIGMPYSDLGYKSRTGELPPNIQQALGRTMIEANKSEAGGLTTGAGIAGAGEFVEGQVRPGDMKGRAKGLLDQGTGRIEDVFTKASAEGADAARKNFNQLTAELWKAVEGAKAFTESIAPMAASLHGAANVNSRNLPQGRGMNTDITGLFSGNAQIQPSGNKPKGK